MKTAVEWLIEAMYQETYPFNPKYSKIFEQAKAMEKEQMVELWNKAVTCESFEQYYNETYKTKTIVTEFRDGSVKVETFKSE
jgi:hemoglobin-like flavoprotein